DVDRHGRVDKCIPDRPTAYESGGLAYEERPLLVRGVARDRSHLVLLSACEHELLHLLAAVHLHDGTEELSLLVRAPRVDGQRATEARRAARLVDMPVQRERGLELLDRLADGGRADGLGGATGVLQPHVLRELRRVVEAGRIRWAVEAEDRALRRRRHLGDHL